MMSNTTAKETAVTSSRAQPDATTEATDQSSTSKKRNAFTELMSPRTKLQKTPDAVAKPFSDQHNSTHFSQALLPYIQHPENFPNDVISYNEHVVLVKDKFPKSIIHLLLLAQDPKYHVLSPITAFSKQHDPDGKFLALMRTEAEKAKHLAASELRRLIGKYSTTQQSRENWLEDHDQLDATTATGEEPPGRDYQQDIKVGIHALPSMATLHIHIISEDMSSEKMKHKKHYNSFNSPFFVELEAFPLANDDPRLDHRYSEGLLKGDMKCWRCGKDFKNQFARLKEHLREEADAWKTL